MPNMPQSDRPDAWSKDDIALAALLAGTDVPADTAAGLQPVAEVLAALRGGPARDELAGEAMALAEFRRMAGVSPQPRRSRRRRPNVLTSLLSAKAAAAAVAALSLGGLATAAFTGTLPAPAQRIAHNVIGAPAAHPSPSGSPAGPDLSNGHSAYGLCTAYQHAIKHGSAAQKSVAFKNLVKAAGGADMVAAFCAKVPHPGSSPSHSPHPTPSHPTGKPTAHPTPSHPTPSHPTGKPTAHPTPSHPAPSPHPSHSHSS
jgi:hypothetical protein